MRCPVCEETQLVISSRESIEIDHCPQCRGVWLDRGELDKIIERAAPSVVGAAPAPPPPPRGGDRPREDRARDDWAWDDRDRSRDDRDRDDRYRYDKKRRKRSFLEDIFDFD